MSTKIHSTMAPLDQWTPNDESCAGAKAYNCARLKQAGFRVPDAIVLMASISEDELAAISG
jgi:phosphoenolpyruvate synthase/pyruvate phosphate dikinase